MSYLNLRDWAVKQRILAGDLQDHTDRHNAYTPLSFSGNVQVRGGMLHGLHVHVPGTPFTPRLPRLCITGDLTGGGKYLARIVSPPGGTLDSTTDLTASEIGELGEVDVAAWNNQEVGETGTHWLTHVDNVHQKYFDAIAVLGVDEAGRTVYSFNGLWVKTCEEE